MAKPIKWMLKQRLVYWAFTGHNQYGKGTYATPVVVRCRWEDVQEEVWLPNGTRFVCQSHLYLYSPILLESFVLLGTTSDPLTEFDLNKTPQQLRAFEVKKGSDVPDLPAKRHLYEAYL